MLRLACLAVLLAAPAAAQDDPRAVAEAYAAALHAADWETVGRLLHPAFAVAYVAGYTDTDDPAILGMLPSLDSLRFGSVDAAREWLRAAEPAEAFAELAAVDGGAAADFLSVRLTAIGGYEAVGAVADG